MLSYWSYQNWSQFQSVRYVNQNWRCILVCIYSDKLTGTKSILYNKGREYWIMREKCSESHVSRIWILTSERVIELISVIRGVVWNYAHHDSHTGLKQEKCLLKCRIFEISCKLLLFLTKQRRSSEMMKDPLLDNFTWYHSAYMCYARMHKIAITNISVHKKKYLESSKYMFLKAT